MPLVRIDLLEGKSPEYMTKLGDIVYQTLVDVVGVPERDRFQVISAHPRDGIYTDKSYLGIDRTDDCILVQITWNVGRSVEKKKEFYKELCARMQKEVNLRPQDIVVNLVDVPKENWSFGNGIAQYV